MPNADDERVEAGAPTVASNAVASTPHNPMPALRSARIRPNQRERSPSSAASATSDPLAVQNAVIPTLASNAASVTDQECCATR